MNLPLILALAILVFANHAKSSALEEMDEISADEMDEVSDMARREELEARAVDEGIAVIKALLEKAIQSRKDEVKKMIGGLKDFPNRKRRFLQIARILKDRKVIKYLEKVQGQVKRNRFVPLG